MIRFQCNFPWTIYSWLSYLETSIQFRDFPLPSLITRGYTNHLGFPEIGGYPQIIHFWLECSIINHPFGGTPFMETLIWEIVSYWFTHSGLNMSKAAAIELDMSNQKSGIFLRKNYFWVCWVNYSDLIRYCNYCSRFQHPGMASSMFCLKIGHLRIVD